MTWLMMLVPLYLGYYTLVYSKLVWKEGNKLGAIATAFIAVSLPLLAIILIKLNR